MFLKNKASFSLLIIALLAFNLAIFIFFFPLFTSQIALTPSSPFKQVLSQFTLPSPPIIKASVPPAISTPNFILVDAVTNAILLSNQPQNRIYPASVTKLATALTALNIYPLDEVVTVNQEYHEGKTMGLIAGEKITIRSLVAALLIYSANDAAFTLASHHPKGITGFVDEMNLIASRYQLKNTHFVNVDGIHDPAHYSTAYDLAQLGRIAIQNPIILDFVKTKNLTVTDVDGQINHPLTSTNELLNVTPEIEGLKTGWTPEAGGCFVGLINLNHHYLISVVTQSTDRFADTQELISWSKNNLSW